MRKYVELFRLTVDQYFVYRLNFILWRLRVVLNLLMIYFLWSAIYLQNREVLGYTKEMMLTYVLLISVLSDIVFSSRVHEVGAEILNGDIINRILKPLPFFKYLLTKEAADKVINVSFSLVETTLLILLTKPELMPPESTIALIVAILQLGIGIALSFWFSFCIAMIAFWTAEIWAPRFIYFILVFVLAGNYFPLDILPNTFYNLLLLTPFPYFIFLPAQIYLKGLESYSIWQFVISISWVLLSYYFAKKLWHKGMKEYSFFGR